MRDACAGFEITIPAPRGSDFFSSRGGVNLLKTAENGRNRLGCVDSIDFCFLLYVSDKSAYVISFRPDTRAIVFSLWFASTG